MTQQSLKSKLTEIEKKKKTINKIIIIKLNQNEQVFIEHVDRNDAAEWANKKKNKNRNLQHFVCKFNS